MYTAVARRLSGQVPTFVRWAGMREHARGHVTILQGDHETVEAEVGRERPHQVVLSLDEDVLDVECDCAAFRRKRTACAHVWATLLAAGQARLLREATKRPSLVLRSAAFEDVGTPEDPAGDIEESLRVLERQQWRKQPITKAPADGGGAATRAQPPWGRGSGQPRWPRGCELRYTLAIPQTLAAGTLTFEVGAGERGPDGTWRDLPAPRILRGEVPSLPDPVDREALSLLAGDPGRGGFAARASQLLPGSFTAEGPLARALIPLVCRNGRARIRHDRAGKAVPLVWDDGGPWELWFELRRDDPAGRYVLRPRLRRGGHTTGVPGEVLVSDSGFLFHGDRVAALDTAGGAALLDALDQDGMLEIPFGDEPPILRALLEQPHPVRLDLPEEFRCEEVAAPPRPCVYVKRHAWAGKRLEAELSFLYGSQRVAGDSPRPRVLDLAERKLYVRDGAAERQAARVLARLGLDRTDGHRGAGYAVPPGDLPRIVPLLLARGFQVEAEGKVYRRYGKVSIRVSSGIGWFDLEGSAEFEGRRLPLPELLAAVRRGDTSVRLGDGTFGMLPEEWLRRYRVLAALAGRSGASVRFPRSQAGLLDALLSALPEASVDEPFRRAREELKAFERVEPAEAPEGFAGELRGYQKEGLGWLRFLDRFRLGGCLADDMGLGKTVQVLAFLAGRREQAPPPRRPVLVVVPRSLLFHWRQEAERFTPRLRVLVHAGTDRIVPGEHFAGYDLVLTTYGTLRADAALLRDLSFGCCVLDEAQAIKNAATGTARAARLVRADLRLALSGTPVENHLGELWSLFEFLNPGMLGTASSFGVLTGARRDPDRPEQALVARVVRPLLLRRTKQEVARELPVKLEETLTCELETPQRRLYDQLRDHYRHSLRERIDSLGMSRSRFQVLEGLLRLRQAACHPGLIDERYRSEPCAKLDVLLPHLAQVVDEGHKALVFSQFTRFLAILRDRLDGEGVPYEYLDGHTRDRRARVERFQGDPSCPLFLISLKAGGLGLNLTAAEYVYLLDPWWNPAVEAQAIDRTHRIGQTRAVFAYRLIARDTVEEKVLELQNTKRDLADAIIAGDRRGLAGLGREDLELLLG